MKKVFVLLVLCLIGSAVAFADTEIKVTGGMQGAVTFQQVDYVETPGRWSSNQKPIDDPLWVAGYGRNGRDLPRFSMGVSANLDDKAGFWGGLDIYPPWNDTRVTGDFEGTPVQVPLTISLAGMAGWYRPFPWMKINIGNFSIQTLRGKVGGFNWYEYLGIRSGGTDGFFSRFEGANAVALELINPIGAFVQDNPWLDGFYVGVMIYDIYVQRAANNSGVVGGVKEAKFIFENLQVALGYEIPDIGHFRVQYIGAHPMANSRRITDNDNNDDNGGPRTQLAFTFTMVPNLMVEVGGTLSHLVKDPINKIPAITSSGLYDTALTVTEGEYLNHHRLGIGAEYNFIELLGVGLRARAGLEYNWGGFSAPVGIGKTDIGAVTKLWFSPSYKLGDCTFGLDVGLNILGDEYWFGRMQKRGGYRYGFGAFAQWDAFPGCFIRTGISFANGEALGNDRVEPRYLDKVLSIPFLFNIGF